MYKESAPKGVERLPSGGIKYRGVTFPGYNKPRSSTRPQKKKMVLAKKGDQVKVVHFGQKGYKHNYSAKAKKSYLARSAGIKGKDDKFSANHWARKVLWPSRQKADGSSKKTASQALYRPRGTLLMTDGKGNVFAGKTETKPKPGLEATSPYYFPGGGIMEEGSSDTPTEGQIRDAVRKEALEELGRKIHKIKLLRSQGLRLDMPDWWVQRNIKKRGIKYKGLDEYYVSAREGKKDDSLHGSEGDAFDGKYYPIEEVASALQRHGEENGSNFAEANKLQAELLRRLKTASAELKAKKDDSHKGLSRYTLGGQAGYALAEKLKAKKEDHATQRLKERTELDPEVIGKLRAAIKANQDQIPDGHHHVTLDDGSRAVIKELRRRHVLATILASNMDRYPGQDLQYLNTKTAGINMGMIRGAGKALMGAGRAFGGKAMGAGRSAIQSRVGQAAIGAGRTAGSYAAYTAGGAGAGAAGGAAVGAYNAKPGNHMNKAFEGAIGGAALGAAGGLAMRGGIDKGLGRKLYRQFGGRGAFSGTSKAVQAGAKKVEGYATKGMGYIDRAVDTGVRQTIPTFKNKLFKPKVPFNTSPQTPQSMYYNVSGKDFVTQGARRAAAASNRATRGPRSYASQILNKTIQPVLNSNTFRLGGGAYFTGSGGATMYDPDSKFDAALGGAKMIAGAYLLGGRGVGSAARAARQAGNLQKSKALQGLYTAGKGAKKVKDFIGQKSYLPTAAKAVGFTGSALGGDRAYQAYQNYRNQ
jgi:hypothetical protein